MMARLFIVLLPWMLVFTAAVSANAGPPSRIIRPQPADLALVKNFRPDWCAAATDTIRLCYGKSTFRETLPVRSLLVLQAGAQEALYVEDEWPRVELLKPDWGIVGPVNRGTVTPEIGRVRVSFDSQGEVEAMRAWTPSLGEISATR